VGSGPTFIRPHVPLDDVMVSVLDINLLPLEHTLLEHGRGADSIRLVRKEFHESIGATFAAAVERMTGRRVIGFLSETHIDPPFSFELFKWHPANKAKARR
jgi:uncharacterized protein YbcI